MWKWARRQHKILTKNKSGINYESQITLYVETRILNQQRGLKS